MASGWRQTSKGRPGTWPTDSCYAWVSVPNGPHLAYWNEKQSAFILVHHRSNPPEIPWELITHWKPLEWPSSPEAG